MMPARAYEYEAEVARPWRKAEPEIQKVPRRLHKPVRKQNYKLFRRRLFVSVVVILAMYAAAVVRSETLVRTGATLINLQQQEAQLIMKNSELKIEVEKLKEPERITQIAEKQLGMSVARSNIYVKAK
ncbi:MAG: cell division protein FtsL [Acidaminococcaceae bacterium]|jgi:cell division protein FtsL|nr:cell division protein FtsL [Acidaminococcaceae bacterium]